LDTKEQVALVDSKEVVVEGGLVVALTEEALKGVYLEA
jgi:hypothetical protein